MRNNQKKSFYMRFLTSLAKIQKYRIGSSELIIKKKNCKQGCFLRVPILEIDLLYILLCSENCSAYITWHFYDIYFSKKEKNNINNMVAWIHCPVCILFCSKIIYHTGTFKQGKQQTYLHLNSRKENKWNFIIG